MSDSEDEDGDNRRDQANFKQNLNKRKASTDAVNGTTVTKVTETIVTTSKPDEVVVAAVAAAENGSTNEVQPSGSETVITTTTTTTTVEEVIKPTSVEGENTAPAPPAEGVTDGMDTSE